MTHQKQSYKPEGNGPYKAEGSVRSLFPQTQINIQMLKMTIQSKSQILENEKKKIPAV